MRVGLVRTFSRKAFTFVVVILHITLQTRLDGFGRLPKD
jgi:hypothetical protein